tara:strand:+ start:976 stop:1173 length:198 start_codon:yes stop_codon:yes gene_type:complete
MRFTKLVNVYLSEDELKRAIMDFIYNEGEQLKYAELLEHLKNNLVSMEWENEEFVISVDGELEDD